jgi:AcrR family transcriptional regulator
MSRAPQQRTLKTREKFLSAAREIIAEQGFSGLRIEDVVARAGTAKGTLFAHFKDKDGLLAVIVGAQVVAHLDQLETQDCPGEIDELIARLTPIMAFAASDRTIFDLLLRYSGSTGELMDETITQFFDRQVKILAVWLSQMQVAGHVRPDQPALMLAEGIQAFQVHVLGLWFCVDHARDDNPADALTPFVQAWLSKQP